MTDRQHRFLEVLSDGQARFSGVLAHAAFPGTNVHGAANGAHATLVSMEKRNWVVRRYPNHGSGGATWEITADGHAALAGAAA